MISHRFKIEEAGRAYALIENGTEPYLGILLEYPGGQDAHAPMRIEISRSATPAGDGVGIGFLGAGNFARMVLLPAVRKAGGFRLRAICSAGGLSATHAAEKHGFEVATTDEDTVIDDPAVNAVFIATRHNEHARQVVKALRADKHVFVEKPLCLTVEELREIETAVGDAGPDLAARSAEHEGGGLRSAEVQTERTAEDHATKSQEPRAKSRQPLLMIGFNRRFSPAAKKVREFFSKTRSPLTISVRFNAGAIPPEHWTQHEQTGGGRIIGEACHGIDLATYLAGSAPVRVYAESVGGGGALTDDQCFITLRHANGSIANIAYLAGGDKAFPKERVEVFGGGQVAVIEDFKQVVTCSSGKRRKAGSWGQDKGHRAEVLAFAGAVRRGGEWPISWEELRAVSLASVLAVRSLREGAAFEV